VCAASLVFICGSACAEWSLLGADKSGAKVYIDVETIQGSKGLVQVSSLTDYPEARAFAVSGESFRSMMAEEEFDCSVGRTRYLTTTLRAEPMGKGAVVSSVKTATAWQDVAPGTVVDDAMKKVCHNPRPKPASPQSNLPSYYNQ
jgi:hypothetical protein